MGRKAKFNETQVPKGPGRKAKKQHDPTFPKGILGTSINFCNINITFYLK